jgi:hypothetical protein
LPVLIVGFKDEAMQHNRINVLFAGLLCIAVLMSGGCANNKPKPYGEERQLFLPGEKTLVWAVAPTINLSGETHVDPLLNSDLVFSELQQVHGLTVIPVNRVVEVYASLKIEKVETEAQAFAVCDLLGADALVIPTVSAFDPYDPPKMGGSLQLFLKPGSYRNVQRLDTHALDRAATPGPAEPMTPRWLMQAVGMFDASDGTVQDRVDAYVKGRIDPNGPFGKREIFDSMDRYCSFVYHELIVQLLDDLQPVLAPPPTPAA